MKLIKTVGALCLAGLAVFTSAAAAADDAAWYVGGDAGWSRARIHDQRIRDGFSGSGLTVTTINDDGRDLGFKLFGGRMFNKNFAVEGGYFNLGKFGYTANYAASGAPATNLGYVSGKTKIQGLNLDGVGILPITDKFSAFGRLGLTLTQAKDHFNSTGPVVINNSTPSKSGLNYKMGLGLQYDFTRALGVRAEWENYRVDDAVGNKGNVNMLLVGLVYKFGTGDSSPRRAAEPAYVAPVAAAAPEPVLIIVPVLTQQYCSILDIQYEINNKTVQREAEEQADTLAIFMRKYPRTTAVIEGHTDEVGSLEANQKLSEQRAQNMVNYLVDHGKIARSRLTAVGYGETRPIGNNKTEAGRRMNRRINALVSCATDIEGIPPVAKRVSMALELEFDRNSAVVKPQYREELRKVANFLKANPKVVAVVEGHTGNVQTTAKTQMEISQRRAQNVMAYLVDNFGVDRSKISAQGFGETRRFAYNTSLEGQQENRRVNIILDFPDQ